MIHNPFSSNILCDKDRKHSMLTEVSLNCNNLSFWFPILPEDPNCNIRLPKTMLIPFPEGFITEEMDDEEAFGYWLEKNFSLEIQDTFLHHKNLFIRNNCNALKLDFKDTCFFPGANLSGAAEQLGRQFYRMQKELVDYSMFDGIDMLVIREYIPLDKEANTLTKGLPLRPELRVFYDFSEHRFIHAVNYWDYMHWHDTLSAYNDDDMVIFKLSYDYLFRETLRLKDKWLRQIRTYLDSVNLFDHCNYPIWSVDFMLNEDACYLIDMHVAHDSFFWDRLK